MHIMWKMGRGKGDSSPYHLYPDCPTFEKFSAYCFSWSRDLVASVVRSRDQTTDFDFDFCFPNFHFPQGRTRALHPSRERERERTSGRKLRFVPVFIMAARVCCSFLCRMQPSNLLLLPFIFSIFIG